MPLSSLLKKFGAWTTLLKWNEPFFYRSRLRGDLGTRLAIALGCGALGTSLLLILFAINNNPPNPLNSLWGMAILGGMAFLFLVRGKSSAGGRVRVCEEGIIRSRQYVGIGTQWVEDASWKYEALRACAIVQGSSLGKSFSLLLLAHDDGLDMIGIPASKDLQQIAGLLNSRGIQVQAAHEIPASLAKRMPLPLGILMAGMGMMALLLGGGVFAARAFFGKGGPQGPVAVERGNVAPAPKFDNLNPGAGAIPSPGPGILPTTPPAPAPYVPFVPRSIEEAGILPGLGGLPAPPPPPNLDAPPGVNPSLPPVPTLPTLPPRPTPATPPTSRPTPPLSPGGGLDGPRIRPGRPAPGKAVIGAATDLVGGTSGVPFENAIREGETVVGFRYLLGRWGTKQALSRFDPLTSRDGGAARNTVVAKEGYAVGGIQVVASELVEAVRIVFVRQKDDGLDKSDFYYSEWIGTPGSVEPRTLGDGATPVVGVCGRRGAVLDALGLLLRKP